METKKRYRLINVFLVILAVNAFFSLLGILITFYLKVPDESRDLLKEMFTLKGLLKQGLSIAGQTLFYYISLNYYNQLMTERKPAIYYLGASFIMLLLVFGFFWGTQALFPQKSSLDNEAASRLFLFSFGISALFFTGASLLLAYLNNLRDEKHQRKLLEAQKLQLEVDKSQANFKFLKSQINPHFLHNTLSFLYAKSLPYSAELSEGILTLSDIMRYALHESNESDDKALLKDEIEHVRNVIRINQLRFSNNLHVKFEVNGMINGMEVIPFLLITIVENAFKHGDLQRVEHPIEIKLTVEENRLYFYCHNKKKSGPKEMSTGLGLDNIRNRLGFAYGSNYKLLIKDETDFYTTELTIDKL
jgi:two-component system, LytTR family, sensor kinase